MFDKRKIFIKIMFGFLLVVAMSFSLTIFGEAKVTSKASSLEINVSTVSAVGGYENELSTYNSACETILAIDSYATNGADGAINDYFRAVSALQNAGGGSEIKQDAQNKYISLSNQKEKKLAYDNACTTLLNIENCNKDNLNSVKTTINDYNSKKSEMINCENKLSALINIDAESKLESLNQQIVDIESRLVKPGIDKKIEYTYDGTTKYFVKSNNNPNGCISGFAPDKMDINCDRGENAGIYDVTISLKDGYKWEDGSTDDLTFFITIKKADYDLTGLQLKDASFVYNGEPHYLYFVDSNNRLTVYEGCLTIMWENNPMSRPGQHTVRAIFKNDDNHNEVEDFVATLTIHEVEAKYLDDNLNEIVKLESSSDGYIECGAKLVVKEMGKDNAPLDKKSISYTQNIKSDEEIYFSYDISLQKNGEEIQPCGKTKIKMIMPSSVEGKEFRLLHIHGDELFVQVEQIDYTLEGNYIVFEVNNLSTFSLVTKVDTSMPVWLIVLISLLSVLVFAVLLIVGLLLKKKKILQLEYSGDEIVRQKQIENNVKLIAMNKEKVAENNNNKLIEESQNNIEIEQEIEKKIDKTKKDITKTDKNVKDKNKQKSGKKQIKKIETKQKTDDKTNNKLESLDLETVESKKTNKPKKVKSQKGKVGRPKKPAKRGRPKKPAKRGRPAKSKK